MSLQLNTSNGFWMPTIVVDEGHAFDREALLVECKHVEIDQRVFFWLLSVLSIFETLPQNTVSRGIYLRALNLPNCHELQEAEMA